MATVNSFACDTYGQNIHTGAAQQIQGRNGFGLGGVASARASQPALDALKFAWDNDKFVAAICAGPTVLADLGITDGKNATCYPGCEGGMGSAKMVADAACVRDGKLITGTSAGCAVSFGLALVEALKGKEMADSIARQIVIR